MENKNSNKTSSRESIKTDSPQDTLRLDKKVLQEFEDKIALFEAEKVETEKKLKEQREHIDLLKDQKISLKHEMTIGGQREYVAVDTRRNRNNGVYFWGYDRTFSDEKRSHSGYTIDIRRAELYTLEEFGGSHKAHICKSVEEAIRLHPGECAVLVKLIDVENYKQLQEDRKVLKNPVY